MEESNHMYIVTNALENLLRNKGRNILLMAIIFVIITTTVVALIINNTSNNVIEDYKTRFSSQVSITPDMEKMREQALQGATSGRISMRMPTISPEMLLSFTQSDALQRSEAYGSLSANSDSLTAIDQSDDVSTDPGGLGGASAGITGTTGPDGRQSFSFMGGGNFRLYGSYWDDFNEGVRALLNDGKSTMPSNNNECLISQDLAELNNISVGDKIKLLVDFTYDIPEGTNMSGYSSGDTYRANGADYILSEGFDGMFRASRTQEVIFTVTGIYDDLKDEYDNANMPKMAPLNHRNEILTTLETLLALRKSNENNIQLTVTYYLKSPDLLEQFEQDVRAMGLSDQFVVTTDASSYDTIVKPVLGLKSITLTFMVVVLVLGAVILILLTSIAVRERKYEIGVLRAMGMKKGKVSLGLWTELLVLTGICLVIGIGVGTVAAQPITDVLITQQAEAVASSNPFATGMPGGSGGPITSGGPSGGSSGGSGGPVTIGMGPTMIGPGGYNPNAKPLSEMDVSLGLLTIIEIIGIALLLATVAGLVATARITKYEPIKILMERN